MKRRIALTLVVILVLLSCIPALATTKKTTASINLRKGAGLSYSIVRTIPKGASLSLGESKTDKRGITWYKTTYKGKTGWVSEVYLKNSSSTNYITASKGETYIRSKPSLSGKKLGTLSKGSSATYLGSMKKDSRGVWWYKVSYKSKTGWVSSKYTKRG